MDHTGWGAAAPILRVADLPVSIAYYRNALGFALDWEHPSIASVSRDRCCIFLSTGGQGEPVTWCWIGVNDVRTLHDELAARGARIRQAPTNFPWALEIQVEDLDRNVLRLGSEPLEGVPHGPFLDMHGRQWQLTGE
jgi:catechol 2,3-dioxygenase-like lactoylglutathione lyase family enzyme